MYAKEVLQAVIWDIDDVLVDTSRTYHESRVAALHVIGLSPERVQEALAVWNRLFWYFDQDDLRGIVLALAHELELDREHVAMNFDRVQEQYDAVWSIGIPPIGGMAGIVSGLHACGVPQAVVSGGDPDYQTEKLKSAGLDIYFNRDAIVVAPSNSVLAKPNPAGILKACAVLKVDARRTLYIGDRISDVIAARLAGSIPVYFDRIPSAPEVRRAPEAGSLLLENPQYRVVGVDGLRNVLTKHFPSLFI
ncbi:HAD family hydrolase [Catellatospora sp. NPDC049133]|uniref:HAD family hydrolase n=1 Tax=Catellatospora sp. NPDC049133 TaxID=3155499 RepID=UPI00341189A4